MNAMNTFLLLYDTTIRYLLSGTAQKDAIKGFGSPISLKDLTRLWSRQKKKKTLKLFFDK